jgi:VanZ family protein
VISLKNIRSAAQWVGLLAVVTIALLSLVPGTLRPHTGAPKELEHFAAYMITAAFLSFGFGKSRYPIIIAFCLSNYSAALELAQIFIPGRQAAVFDFVASSSGAFAGCLLAWLILRAVPTAFA